MKNTITLNIGLDTNDGGKLALHNAIITISRPFNIVKSRLDASPNGGEETLVLIIEKPIEFSEFEYQLTVLCGLLKQDCIAWHDGENGHLTGPKADAWLPFNHAYFLTF